LAAPIPPMPLMPLMPLSPPAPPGVPLKTPSPEAPGEPEAAMELSALLREFAPLAEIAGFAD